jgi:hypothetical protein
MSSKATPKPDNPPSPLRFQFLTIRVPVPVRRIHAVLHDADPTRWGSPPPPPDRFIDRHDAIADRINAVDWNMGEDSLMP